MHLDLTGSPLSYTRILETIGSYVCKATKYFFQNLLPSQKSQRSTIALNPKLCHAEDVVDFKSISLCNIFNKIILKILANNLKPIITSLIHPAQVGFI